MKCLVAIVGPTAIGKSAAAVSVSQRYNGEVVNADSRQIYKYMDIGTAKPSIREQQGIPHHLLDIIFPDNAYSVALYKRSAVSAISQIQAKGKLPVIVGGSGQYIWSVLEGWQIPEVKPDFEFRRSMQQESIRDGGISLYLKLKDIDPVTASRILPGNIRRTIRALEIYRKTGQKPSVLQTKVGLDYPVLIIGMTAPRNVLYERINLRTDNMINAGFVDEVQELINLGYSDDLPSMSSLGYGQLSKYLKGKMSLIDAVQQIKYKTHRFARSQYSWFRLNDNRIHWFDINDDIQNKINYTIQTFLDDCQ